ncbi:DNA cytosine methyltransferase [Streptomyces sp. NPDC001922]|uniref:DNA cytosine methyltransferase n=1 Tax=Streptomyces sp. NPDC001922 TaxID=3364624 RepID=UPI0036B55C6A
MSSSERSLTSIEICAGAGGQAVGLHQAMFKHLALVEIDKFACRTLRANVQGVEEWGGCEVLEEDLVDEFDALRTMTALRRGDSDCDGGVLEPRELDLLAGGVPCPPFSHAGKQLGEDDDRDLFPRMLGIVQQLQPRAVMIENVRGILDSKFDEYRGRISSSLEDDGRYPGGHAYQVCEWDLLEACDFGVPQLRPRALLVAIRKDILELAALEGVKYEWPTGVSAEQVTVAKALGISMQERLESLKRDHPELAKRAQAAYDKWLGDVTKADSVAPTLVGGSKKHGGADLGPSRAKAAWRALGVDPMGVANDPEACVPERDFLRPDGPMLTVEQAAIIQGFPRGWKFEGGKTARYRQVGNAFPPPVAKAVGESIAQVLMAARRAEDRGAAVSQQDSVSEISETELAPAFADDAADREGALIR